MRAPADAIEDEGIRRARRRAELADLKIAVFDGAAYPTQDPATIALVDSQTLAVTNKADLVPESARRGGGAFMSIKTGAGIEEFLTRLHAAVRAKSDTGGAVILTRARHRKALEECVAALQRARAAPLPELAAEDLRLAARALGRLTGRVDVEEVLDAAIPRFLYRQVRRCGFRLLALQRF